MKRFFTLFLLLAIHQAWAFTGSYASAPTKAPKNFTLNGSDGDRIHLVWASGDGANRIVIARKAQAVSFMPVDGVSYNASANFGAGNEVSTGEFVVYNGNNSSTSVTNLQPNTVYHFAIYEYNGTGSGIAYLSTSTATSGATLSAPTGQPSGLTVSNIIGNSLKLNWINPIGAAAGSGRIVIGRQGAPVNVNPLDLVNYSSNPKFGSGSEIGNGNFVLAKTTANNVTVEGLNPSTQYHFAIFEYKGSNGLVFNIIAPPSVSVATLPRPTVNAYNPQFNSVEGKSMKFLFTRGNGAKRIIVARAGAPVTALPVDGATYTADDEFGKGQELAPGQFVLANGTVDNVAITGLAKATPYYFTVYEYDGEGTATAYLVQSPLAVSQATVSAPTKQAAGINITVVGNSSVTFNWAIGDGARRMVIMRKDMPVNVTPQDLASYGSSANFGSGTHMGNGNYVVYNNNGSTATVSNLAAGTTYYFAIYEYNGSTAPVYLLSDPPVAQFTTTQSPTQPSKTFELGTLEGNRLHFSWTNGNGNRRLVVLKAGSAVMGTPQDGMTYSAKAAFGTGDQIAPGEFVMGDGNINQVNATNLQTGITYHIAVFEYNLVNNLPYYLSTPGTFQGTTAVAPTANSYDLQISHVTGNSMKLTWSKGDGARRLVIVKAGGPVDMMPANYTYYNDNSGFGSGAHLGNGNYSVFSSSGNTVTVTSLLPGVTYHFAIVEYNGLSYPVYLNTGVLTASRQTAMRPGTPASNLSFTSIEGNKMTVSWNKGDGARRILVGRAGSPVTALPQDGVDYVSNTAFGSGDAILPGQFVLTDGTLAEATISNLQPATTYHFAVFEYDGTGTDTRYITIPGEGIKATLSAPADGPANILFSNIGTSTATINWTKAAADKHLVVIRKAAPVSALPQQLTSYSSSTSYGHNGSLMAPEHYVLHNGSASNIDIVSLQPGTTYHVSIFAFNGHTGPMYNSIDVPYASFTTLGPPTEAAKDLVFTGGGDGASVNIRWKNGSGQRRLVLMRVSNAVNALPAENTSYVANSFFGSGQQLGAGNYVVYNGMGDNVTVNNLQKELVYHVAVFEYNQFSTGPVYLTTAFAAGQFSGIILPVSLSGFSGVAVQSSNRLQWTTAQEVNVEEFIVERSADGRTFESIGGVAAVGHSVVPQSYGFEDKSRLPVAYYRLRIIDKDGKAGYSAVIRLQASKEEGLKLFPTLAATSVQLSLTVAERTTALFRIVDLSGRVVTQRSAKLEAGVVTTAIDVSRLVKGTYLLQVQTGERVLVERFIKQ